MPSKVQIDKLIRSRRRSIGLSITKEARLIVRAPLRTSIEDIERILEEKSRWIISKQSLLRERLALLPPPIPAEERSQLKQKALVYIAQRVEHFAQLTGLKYVRIRVNNAQTRWGSCGGKGTLNFSWRLILAPYRVIDYVVVHELMHLKQMNHSYKFWHEVKTIIPDYKLDERWLKDNGHRLSI